MLVVIGGEQVIGPHAHLEWPLPLLVTRYRDQFFRHTNIAFAVGGMLQQLSEIVAIALGRLDILPFHRKPPLLLPTVHHDTVDSAVGNEDIITLAVGQRTELSFKAPRALVDEVE